ncbi:MAG: SIS domain-containing protein [Firmicutes bacterium]|nr:SIS domain-containing protein [Bacillota bacterium]
MWAMDAFERAIREQGEVFAQALPALAGAVAATGSVLRRWGEDGGRRGPLWIAGMGSSFHAAVAGAVAFQRRGWPALAVEAAELLHYGLGAVTPESPVLLVSQSGESAEVVALLERLRGHERLLGVTNEAGSTLGREVPLVLPLALPPDGGVAVKTFGWSLAALVLLAEEAAGGAREAGVGAAAGGARAALEEAVEHLRRDGEALFAAARAAVQLFEPGRTPVFVGRGPALATAGQAALTFQEVLARPALAMGAGQFRHGPMELFGGEVVLAAVARGSTADLVRRLAGEAETSACPVLLLDEGNGVEWAPTEAGDGYLEVPALADELAPLYDVAFFQALVGALAAREGRTPGQFQFADPVTREE